MPSAMSVEVTGLKELAEKLAQMGPRLERNGLRAAVSAGAEVIRKEARARAPVATGTLRRAFYKKQIREQSGQKQQTFFVGVRSGKRYAPKGQDAYYWRFQEFGTAKMPARPFLRPAFESKKNEAVEAMKKKLRDRIEQLAAGRK